MFSHSITVILFFSILLQLVSAVISIILIRKSGFRSPWLLISLAISLMAIRRITTLANLLGAPVFPDMPLGPELISLVISGLMLFGLFLLQPVFHRIRDRQDEADSTIRDMGLRVREAHHHVKNDLLFLHSMINLQKNCLARREDIDFLDQLSQRIRTLSLLHERMYSEDNLSLKGYLDGLVRVLEPVLVTGSGIRVRIFQHVDDCEVLPKELLYCGLIVNESVTNACRHAFSGIAAPEIRITSRTLTDGKHQLAVSDNGTGLPEGKTGWDNGNFGFTLLQCINNTNGWNVSQESGSGGLKIIFEF